METKVIIDDPVIRHGGSEEKELPKDTAIRFEINGDKYIVKFEEAHGSLSVQKMSDKGLLESCIRIRPSASNKIILF